MKQTSPCTTFRNLSFVAIVVSLLTSGFTRPLLVQCTTAEGRTILELIGQDPHHHDHSEHFCEPSKSAPDASFSSSADDCGDCVDIFLNHAGILRVASYHPSPASIWGEFGNPPAAMGSAAFRTSPLLFDPALQTALHPQFKPPLLI